MKELKLLSSSRMAAVGGWGEQVGSTQGFFFFPQGFFVTLHQAVQMNCTLSGWASVSLLMNGPRPSRLSLPWPPVLLKCLSVILSLLQIQYSLFSSLTPLK